MPQPKDKVTVWETFDGKEFEFEGEAERHESELWAKGERDISSVIRSINHCDKYK